MGGNALRAASFATLLLAVLAPRLDADETAADSWRHLETLRRALESDSPLVADFVQTFTPSGFSDGDVETGTVSLDLPDCIRWDYREPYAKTYLVCEGTAYTWNEGETSGRRAPIPPEERAGLDLLRLETSALAESFAASRAAAHGATAIELRRREEETRVRSAILTISPDGSRLESLAFSDSDGNRTVFRLENYRELPGGEALQPPADLSWIDE